MFQIIKYHFYMYCLNMIVNLIGKCWVFAKCCVYIYESVHIVVTSLRWTSSEHLNSEFNSVKQLYIYKLF